MKKKIALISLGIFFVIGIVIQFVPYGRNHFNPPITGEPKWDSANTKELFSRACADCHSNQTVWPWYSNVAPMSWLVQKDVEQGRAKFNVSEWGKNRENEGDEAAETVQEGEMPMTAYIIMHPSASLSNQEKADFIAGLSATFGEGINKNGTMDKSEKEEDD